MIISILFTLPFGVITFAGNSEIIKVALNSQFGTVSSVEFSNSSIVFGCQNGNDFIGKTNVSGTVFSLKGCSGYYVCSDKTFSTYDDVKKSTDSVGVPALEDDGKWRIYFGGYSSEADATSKKVDFAKYGVGSVVKTEKNAVALFCNGQIYAIFNGKDCLGIVKDAQGGNIIVNQKPYRGGITLCSNGSGYNVVNVIDVDEYLYGVLPVEMAVEWPREALKAQAVVARNFAIYSRNGKHANEPYDLCVVESDKVNTMILQTMKKCLFQYQIKAYNDYEGEKLNTVLFDKRVEQIANILPALEILITQQTDQN